MGLVSIMHMYGLMIFAYLWEHELVHLTFRCPATFEFSLLLPIRTVKNITKHQGKVSFFIMYIDSRSSFYPT